MFYKNVVLYVISGCSVPQWPRIFRAAQASYWQEMAYNSLLIRHVPIPVAK